MIFFVRLSILNTSAGIVNLCLQSPRFGCGRLCLGSRDLLTSAWLFCSERSLRRFITRLLLTNVATNSGGTEHV